MANILVVSTITEGPVARPTGQGQHNIDVLALVGPVLCGQATFSPIADVGALDQAIGDVWIDRADR